MLGKGRTGKWMKHLQVYYLNLARRPDRNERFLKVNAGIAEFCRMAAVDGDSVRNEDLVADGVIVGSAFVRHLEKAGSQSLDAVRSAIGELAYSLAAALNPPGG